MANKSLLLDSSLETRNFTFKARVHATVEEKRPGVPAGQSAPMKIDQIVRTALRVIVLGSSLVAVLIGFVISAPAKENSLDCSAGNAENEIRCAMGAASSTEAPPPAFTPPPSPTIESVTRGLQSLHVRRNSAQYFGTINQVLDQVLSRLKLQEDDIKETNKFLDRFVKQELISGLKEQSKLFAMLFKEIAWTGSFYEGLKIAHPDEFDLNVVLNMPPFRYRNGIMVESHDQLFGYVTVHNFGTALKELEADPKWKPVYPELLRWTDVSGKLLQSKVSQWMEGIVIKFANKYNLNAPPDMQIRVTKSGPAKTLIIGNLSIDVVPVFAFTEAPPHPIKVPRPLNREWVIVPKPQKNAAHIKDAWRVNFYQFEKDILRDYGKIKPAIKLIKKLRDNQHWDHALYSYAIKTIALLMKESGELSEYDKIDIAFIKLLRKVRQYLEEGFLPFYWDDRDNLLKMTSIERSNYAGRLGNLIKKFEFHWETNPAFIGDSIVPESRTQIEAAINQAHEQDGGDNSCFLS